MAAILLKDVPDGLRQRLKTESKRNRRSMTQEAICLLEEALHLRMPAALPKPVATKKPFSQQWLSKAIQAGRA